MPRLFNKNKMTKTPFPLSQVYTLIEPGPVVMVTTAREGRPNIMTLSWSTMIDFNPPLLGCVVGDRSYTFDLLKKTRECVINIPPAGLAKKAVACGNISGRTVDKFKAFGLTPVKASCVKVPMIGECYANLECKVIDRRMAARYNLFILKVVRAWIDPRKKSPRTIHHLGKGVFRLSGKTVRLPSHMK
jgi:flavin reductase (DIM6/NTAB) family NADH-FMN oxidoreductase RutF